VTVALVILIAVGSAVLGVAGTLLFVVPPVLRRIRRDNAAHRAQLEEGIRRALTVHVVDLPTPQERHLRLVATMGRIVSAAALAAAVEVRHALAVVRGHPVQTAAAASVAVAVVATSIVLLPAETPTQIPDASRSHAPPAYPQLPRQALPDRRHHKGPAPAPSSAPGEEPPPPVEPANDEQPADEEDAPQTSTIPPVVPKQPDEPDVPTPDEPEPPPDPEPDEPDTPDEPPPDEEDPPLEVGCGDDPGLCVNVNIGEVPAADVLLGLPSPDSQSRIYAPASRTGRYAVTA
jgi:hypothetical protein